MENNMPKRLQKHIVLCPHCGAQALDHMTQCPKCMGQLTPRGYTPMLSAETKKTVRIVLWIALSILAIALIIWRFKSNS